MTYLCRSETKISTNMSKKGSITTADYLPYPEYKRLVETLSHEEKYWWACYCIVSFCTGLRFSDVSRLRWRDIVGQKKIIITEQKTSKTKSIAIGSNASEHISKLYEALGNPPLENYFMATDKSEGKPVSIQYINRYLKKMKDKYELDIENFSAHTFRKTFGRYVYEKSGRTNESLLYLNRIFRHQNIDTTMIYLGIRDEEISNIFESIEI